jgi:hypothetical protein
MRKVLMLALLVAIVALPMAYGGAGFCRSMPCCPPQAGAQMVDPHQPDCCNPTNCTRAPAGAAEYTSAKQITHHAPTSFIAVLPTTQAPIATPDESRTLPSPVSPPSLQRRIALLSTLVI